jgi:hypothetical protein
MTRMPRLFVAALAAMVLAGLVSLAARALAARAPARAASANALSSLPTHPQPKTTPVPQGFVGVDVDGPLISGDNSLSLADQMQTMVSDGVQSIRMAFNWAAAEPYATPSQVPADQASDFTTVNGVPVDFSTTDQTVSDAAKLHLQVLPTVLYAPSWDSVHNANGVDFPRRPGPYAAYVAALIGRYGPNGSFWTANPSIPKQPIRQWQIWNEPNIAYYWRQPFAAGYAQLLKAAHAAIHKADPGAKTVLGALTDFAWVSFAHLATRPGLASDFDIAAVNGFTKKPADVIKYMLFMRRAMNRYGAAGKPLLATEVSWPSAVGQTKGFDFDTTQAGQARNLAALMPMIAANYQQLGLAGFDWYTWMGAETRNASTPFAFSGLLAFANGDVRTKPVLKAYRAGALRLEGCRSKGPLATDCRH